MLLIELMLFYSIEKYLLEKPADGGRDGGRLTVAGNLDRPPFLSATANYLLRLNNEQL